MPPKPKPAAPSKKTEQKKKEKVIEVRHTYPFVVTRYCVYVDALITDVIIDL